MATSRKTDPMAVVTIFTIGAHPKTMWTFSYSFNAGGQRFRAVFEAWAEGITHNVNVYEGPAPGRRIPSHSYSNQFQ